MFSWQKGEVLTLNGQRGAFGLAAQEISRYVW
jgi:hypothetical protein